MERARILASTKNADYLVKNLPEFKISVYLVKSSTSENHSKLIIKMRHLAKKINWKITERLTGISNVLIRIIIVHKHYILNSNSK